VNDRSRRILAIGATVRFGPLFHAKRKFDQPRSLFLTSPTRFSTGHMVMPSGGQTTANGHKNPGEAST
jgi:hypothetical protein